MSIWMRMSVVWMFGLPCCSQAGADGLVPKPPAGDFEQVYKRIWFAPNGAGYVASEFVLLRTTNRGATWTPIAETFRDGRPGIREIFFVNESTFFVYGWRGFWRTVDAGRSFQPATVRVPEIDDRARHDQVREGFFFLDADRGWAFGDKQLLLTSDGGKTWRQRRLRRDVIRLGQPDGLWVFDEQHGIAIGADHVFRTEDEGRKWLEVPNSPTLSDVRCTTSGFCIGLQTRQESVAYVTTDAGQTWQPTTTGINTDQDTVHAFQAIAFNDAVIVGTHNDQGRSERAVHSRTPVPTSPPDRGLLVRWNGSAWQRREYPAVSEFHAVHFVDANEAWASADFNGILHSTDGGQTWTFVPDYYRQVAALTPAPSPLFLPTPTPTH